jgi:hypothetical protein
MYQRIFSCAARAAENENSVPEERNYAKIKAQYPKASAKRRRKYVAAASSWRGISGCRWRGGGNGSVSNNNGVMLAQWRNNGMWHGAKISAAALTKAATRWHRAGSAVASACCGSISANGWRNGGVCWHLSANGAGGKMAIAVMA